MENWHCFKDKVPLNEIDVLLTYLDITQPTDGFKCPVCGMVVLSEETVVEKINKAEEMLENK